MMLTAEYVVILSVNDAFTFTVDTVVITAVENSTASVIKTQKHLHCICNSKSVNEYTLFSMFTYLVGGVAQWLERRTFRGLRHDVQLTGDLLGVNRPLYVSQRGQLSHSSSWGG